MRLLASFFLAFLFGTIGAQELNNPNKLKLCPKDQNARYHNCWGTYTFDNGDRYQGEFKNDKYHGQGTYYYLADDQWKGDKYVGEYKDGKPNGQGIYYFLADNKFKGDRYQGEFKDDNFYGQGTYTHASGDKYVGEYKDGRRNGQGTYYHLADDQWKGNKYVGEYKDDWRNGQGIYFFSNGAKEVGEFNGGKLNGRAIKLNTDGSVAKSGLFRDDKLVESFKVDPLSFARIRRYLIAEQSGTNSNSALSESGESSVAEAQQDSESLAQNDRLTDSRISTDNRKRFALVIGNGSYNSLPKLPNAINDARVITQSLRSAGFQVSTHENLDLAGMQNAIRVFGEKLGKNDVGLVYYAGHGVQVKGKNYLIPVKENIKKSFEVPSSAVDVDLVLATLEHIKNDLNIVVLDACRSSFPGEARGTNRGLATIEAAKGTFIAFATAPGKEALDGSGSNSPYTKHLARLIGKKGLPLEQVFKEVRKAVVAETNGEQVPWENSSLMGDFYFQK